MSSPTPSVSRSPVSWLLWPYRALMLTGACVAFVAAWVALAWSSGSQASWMALLAALDVAWVLRLLNWPAGRGRAVVGIVATVAMVVATHWWIIAAHLGAAFGLPPWESAARLGLHHAWLMAQLANGPLDLLAIAAALLLAALLSR